MTVTILSRLPRLSVLPKTVRIALAGFAALIAVAAFQAPAQAQSVRLIGDFRDWSAYTTANSADRLCFVNSQPVAVEPQLEGLSQAYVYVTHRPSEGIRYEINLVAGYEFAPDTLAEAQIGGQRFSMFTEGDAAWLEDASQSANMAAAMRAGSSLVIEGTSVRGVKVRETFSLSGATASMRAIDGEC
ncbi:invasion associated locus B family protein [Cucumibacter marinus]|uniref:invasion associated locus B family protein n=1 Tax=Cucumibacter marinus TaxID=1121252 RepID=UPI00041E3A3F|nr:invasion associated locus B family protein [Cucumibacter marinus]